MADLAGAGQQEIGPCPDEAQDWARTVIPSGPVAAVQSNIGTLLDGISSDDVLLSTRP